MGEPTPRRSGIYVEILIRSPLDTLWQHTQEPALHERWDLRFTRIEYLPRESAEVPQRFRYVTRIGLGLTIAGGGESTGQRDLPGGERVSALKFWSGDRLSLIREGAGYWRYVPTPEGVRFLTWYDYRTRFGVAGTLLDRLRLWLEQGIAPERALRHFLTRVCARVTLGAVFFYHGLVPKLLGNHPDEVAMIRDNGVTIGQTRAWVLSIGGLEIGFALVLLLAWTRRWPALLSIGLMLLATAGVAWSSPRYLGAAFNPVTLNLCVVMLAIIDLLHLDDAPSASRCRRLPMKGPVTA